MSDKSTEQDEVPCLRDMFAVGSLIGILSSEPFDKYVRVASDDAYQAYAIADAMLEARKK